MKSLKTLVLGLVLVGMLVAAGCTNCCSPCGSSTLSPCRSVVYDPCC